MFMSHLEICCHSTFGYNFYHFILFLKSNIKKQHFFPVFKVIITKFLVSLQPVIGFRILIGLTPFWTNTSS